jgi:tripartite ATP-independent transporter DctM subunit
MKSIFAGIDRLVEWLVAAIFGSMVLIGFFQVFSRFVLNKTPSWSEEIQIFGHIWLVFLAIPIAYRRGAHFTVEAIRRQYSVGMHKGFDLFVEFLWAGFAVATAYYSYRVSLVAGRSVSPGLEIPMSYPYYGMITFLLTLLLATMLIGIPILLCIALIGFIGIALLPGVVMPLFAQKMFGQLDSFTLLAMPYFILAGSIMTAGGISRQLVDFARALVGHFRAGLAHASIVASMAVAGVSGSSTADAAAIGSIVIPTMKQTGYKAGFAAALIATAGTIGAIIPPSMTMVIYGAIAQVSIGGLFLGGILPGILVGLALMATVKLYTYHPGYPELREVTGRFDLCALWLALRSAWSGLLAPLIIVGGILSGIFTATEAGVVACVYAFIIGYFIERKIKLKDLVPILVDSAITTAMVSGIIAVSGPMGWLLSYLEFNDIALGFVTALSQSPTVVLLIIAAAMLLLGTFVDSLIVLLVFAPVAISISKTYGLDPYQVGLVMVMCNQIGAVSPPTAPLLFVTTSIARTPIDETNRHVWTFMLAETFVLLLVILFPGLSSWIPKYFLG